MKAESFVRREGHEVGRYRDLFADAADAMLVLDNDRRVVDANRTAASLFRRDVNTLSGSLLVDLFVDADEELNGAWRELMSSGESKCQHRVTADGQAFRLIECSYRRTAECDRHLCIARDITERRLLEERLLQSEKVESVGRLAGGIAHDFNNLLTAILGYTELLLSDRAPSDPDRSDLEEIQKAGQRAAALTQQLLAYSRKQVLVPKEVDLNQTVSNLRGMLARLIREDIVLSAQLSPEPAIIKIDPTQLEQVILNLVLNARDALPSGGSISLEVSRARLSARDVPPDQLAHSGEYVRLRVVDNGVGIAPEVKPHLFEPFFTTKEIGKGTGLGLASVYGIVRQSNGFIDVESEPGRGTRFTMHFPAVGVAESTGEASGQDAASVGGGHETILLVEDEDSVRALASAVLRRQGYEVLEAATPGIAWELFQKHRTSIDLLLTDVILPEMNGPALAQRLIVERSELRVLFISGYADVASLDPGSRHVSFLSKPFQASMLAAKVREALTKPRLGS